MVLPQSVEKKGEVTEDPELILRDEKVVWQSSVKQIFEFTR